MGLVRKREFMALFNATDVTPYDSMLEIMEWNRVCDLHDRKPALHGSPGWRVDKKITVSPYMSLLRIDNFLEAPEEP